MEKMMPILKPEGYRNDIPLFIKENLFNSPSSPVVAYGKDFTTHIGYDSAKDEAGFEVELLKAKEEALKNLKQINLNIQIQLVEGVKLAFISGHEYAAEKILDKEFMSTVAERIDAIDLMVGIPFKGQMIAIDSMSPLRSKFPNVILKYFENPQQDVISPHVFLVRKGEIIAIGGSNVKEQEGNSYSYSENTDTHNYTVLAKCSTVEELKDIVNATYQEILVTIANTKEFGGEIIFKIDGEIQDSPELRERCRSFQKSIHSNELAQTIIKTFTTNNIKTTFYLKDELIDLGSNLIIEDETKLDIPAVTPSPEKESNSKNTSLQPAVGNNSENNPPTSETNTNNNTSQEAKTEMQLAEEADYSNLSLEELDSIYYEILSIPNARTNVSALIRMTKLMDAYEQLGTVVPKERGILKKKAKRPENWGKSNPVEAPPVVVDKSSKSKSIKQEQSPAKKWWEFWKL